jgi:drug/metabolite transporter (DMT)-like permease
MDRKTVLVASISTILAALGQIALKMGAGQGSPMSVAWSLATWLGLACYGAGVVLWIIALSSAPLTVLYPFTALTFCIVYVASGIFFEEKVGPLGILGVLLVLTGLALVQYSGSMSTNKLTMSSGRAPGGK